jgi:hypothetical protein
VSDFKAAVWFPDEVLIPLKIISDPVSLFSIVERVCLNNFSARINSIFSKNSGMTERLAAVIVYRVTRHLWFFSKVSVQIKLCVLNDFADPLPPVNRKYRLSLSQSGAYFQWISAAALSVVFSVTVQLFLL